MPTKATWRTLPKPLGAPTKEWFLRGLPRAPRWVLGFVVWVSVPSVSFNAALTAFDKSWRDVRITIDPHRFTPRLSSSDVTRWFFTKSAVGAGFSSQNCHEAIRPDLCHCIRTEPLTKYGCINKTKPQSKEEIVIFRKMAASLGTTILFKCCGLCLQGTLKYITLLQSCHL